MHNMTETRKNAQYTGLYITDLVKQAPQPKRVDPLLDLLLDPLDLDPLLDPPDLDPLLDPPKPSNLVNWLAPDLGRDPPFPTPNGPGPWGTAVVINVSRIRTILMFMMPARPVYN